MSKEYHSLEELKENIDNSLTDITKCYLLINYAYNTSEEMILYTSEFKKRYNNFYRTISIIELELDESKLADNKDLLKQMLGIDEYKNKMGFLDNERLENELEDKDDTIDLAYETKAANTSVKLNFYHNNHVEFGPKTRFHIDTDKYSTIDPVAKTEEEKKYIFEVLTNFYLNNFSYKKSKTLKKDM